MASLQDTVAAINDLEIRIQCWLNMHMFVKVRPNLKVKGYVCIMSKWLIRLGLIPVLVA